MSQNYCPFNVQMCVNKQIPNFLNNSGSWPPLVEGSQVFVHDINENNLQFHFHHDRQQDETFIIMTLLNDLKLSLFLGYYAN